MTEVRTLTLAEFILARIAEDEAYARRAMVVIGDDLAHHEIAEWWEKPEHGRVYAGHWHRVAESGAPAGQRNFPAADSLPHIARHDPARVLADCEVKRAMIQAACPVQTRRVKARPGVYDYVTFPIDPDPHSDAPGSELAWDVVRLLALPYADHPDYNESWRP